MTEERQTTIKEILSNWYLKELQNFYLYTQISYIADLQGFEGTKKLFHEQAEEELEHSEKVTAYATAKGIEIDFLPIELVVSIDSTTDYKKLYETGLALEQSATDFFEEMIKLNRLQFQDTQLEIVLMDIQKEQIEELDKFSTLYDQVSKLKGDNEFLMYDIELKESLKETKKIFCKSEKIRLK